MLQRIPINFRGGGQQKPRLFVLAPVPAPCASPAIPPSTSVSAIPDNPPDWPAKQNARHNPPAISRNKNSVTSCSMNLKFRLPPDARCYPRARSQNCPSPPLYARAPADNPPGATPKIPPRPSRPMSVASHRPSARARDRILHGRASRLWIGSRPTIHAHPVQFFVPLPSPLCFAFVWCSSFANPPAPRSGERPG